MPTRTMMSWCAILLFTACAGETGTLRVAVSGEEAAVQGWPVDDVGFVDGWSLTFSTLVVNVGGFELRGADAARASVDGADSLVDLRGGVRVLYTLEGIDARRWEDVRYVLRPATAASIDEGPVDASVRARMIEQGWSVYLEATATKDGVTRTLAWGLDLDVLNRGCVGGDETDGVVVRAGGVTEAEITLHWDHLFFDSLVLDDAQMRFDAMSAVADAEGSVTLDALDRQRLADLRDAEGNPLLDAGGAPVVYDPGSAALPEPTLLHHMRAAATTVGHWNGEGHCDYEVRR